MSLLHFIKIALLWYVCQWLSCVSHDDSGCLTHHWPLCCQLHDIKCFCLPFVSLKWFHFTFASSGLYGWHCWSVRLFTTLIQTEVCWQLLDGLLRNIVQTFMVPWLWCSATGRSRFSPPVNTSTPTRWIDTAFCIGIAFPMILEVDMKFFCHFSRTTWLIHGCIEEDWIQCLRHVQLIPMKVAQWCLSESLQCILCTVAQWVCALSPSNFQFSSPLLWILLTKVIPLHCHIQVRIWICPVLGQYCVAVVHIANISMLKHSTRKVNVCKKSAC